MRASLLVSTENGLWSGWRQVPLRLRIIASIPNWEPDPSPRPRQPTKTPLAFRVDSPRMVPDNPEMLSCSF
ncbi:hypothetical protein BJX64DRAFT_124652 [Aspergillus heterothallicus]